MGYIFERSKRRDGLTDKMVMFANEYPVDMNGKQAAIRAGYLKRTAAVQASKLLKDTRVMAIINTKIKAREKRVAYTADDVLEYIHSAIDFNPLEFFDPGDNGGWLIDKKKLKEIPHYIGRLIEAVEERTIDLGDGRPTITKFWVKLIGKSSALALAAKHQLDPLREMALDNKEGAVSVEVVDWSPMTTPGNVPDEVEARILDVESRIIQSDSEQPKLEDKS